jgi:hypothetical protein
VLSRWHGISLEIRRLPRQRRQIQRTRLCRRQGPVLPKRSQTRPNRPARSPSRRIPGRLRRPPRFPYDPISTRRRYRRGSRPDPRQYPLAPPPRPDPRIQNLRERDHSPGRRYRRGVFRNRRQRPPRVRFQETCRRQQGPPAPNPLRNLAHPHPRPGVQAPHDPPKITKRTQARATRRSSMRQRRLIALSIRPRWRELQLAASASADVPSRRSCPAGKCAGGTCAVISEIPRPEARR